MRHKINNKLLESSPNFSLIDSKGMYEQERFPKMELLELPQKKGRKIYVMVHKYDAEISELEE